MLAGVSADYYVRLERAGPHPSVPGARVPRPGAPPRRRPFRLSDGPGPRKPRRRRPRPRPESAPRAPSPCWPPSPTRRTSRGAASTSWPSNGPRPRRCPPGSPRAEPAPSECSSTPRAGAPPDWTTPPPALVASLRRRWVPTSTTPASSTSPASCSCEPSLRVALGAPRRSERPVRRPDDLRPPPGRGADAPPRATRTIDGNHGPHLVRLPPRYPDGRSGAEARRCWASALARNRRSAHDLRGHSSPSSASSAPARSAASWPGRWIEAAGTAW